MKYQYFPFSEERSHRSHISFSEEIESQWFPAGIVHPDTLQHSLTSSGIGLKLVIGICG